MATVATFIGAGGLGERIVAGLAVNDTAFMLAGAVPAALLALLTQWLFDGIERWVAPVTRGGGSGSAAPLPVIPAKAGECPMTRPHCRFKTAAAGGPGAPDALDPPASRGDDRISQRVGYPRGPGGSSVRKEQLLSSMR